MVYSSVTLSLCPTNLIISNTGDSRIVIFKNVDDDAYDDDGERLSVYDAALIWESNGRDEDYTFGYSEDELEDAL